MRQTRWCKCNHSYGKQRRFITTDPVPAGKTSKQLWFCHSLSSEPGAIESNEEISGNTDLVVREAYLSCRCHLVGGDGSFTTQLSSHSETSSWHRSTCPERERNISLPISYTGAIGKGRGRFAGHFSLWNFWATWFEGHRIPYRVQDVKGLFLQKVFFVKRSPGILFSDCHSKAGYFNESLVVLVAQSLVGSTAASGITSSIWTQSLWHHLSCLSSGNSISSDSCWEMFFSAF